MSRLFGLLVVFMLVSLNTHAFEPVVDQQGMFYVNVAFDVGHSSKPKHEFGFRFDRSLVRPGDTLGINQLADKPAVFNIKMNSRCLQAFQFNVLDYSREVVVHRGSEAGETEATEDAAPAETTETQPVPPAETKRELDIPLGVIIGILIGAAAVAG